MAQRRVRLSAFAVGTIAVLGAGTLVSINAYAATGCRVDYAISSQWQGGFGANVTVTNLGDPVNGWTLTWSFTAGQTVTQAWNATVTQSGTQVSAASVSYNAALATNGSAAFGFNGSWNNSTNPVPSTFALNGVGCTGGTVPATTAPTSAAPTTAVPTTTVGNGSPTDPNIKYVGRWDTSVSTAYVPNWTGGYLQTAFTGTTVKIKQRSAVNIYASIDGGAWIFYSASGTINLTPTALKSGVHQLKVEYRSGDTVFQGLTFDTGAGTVAPTFSPKVLEFIGDSITAGYLTTNLAVSAYGFLLGEQLGVGHTLIARAGYCLVAQDGCVGQQSQFYKLTSDGSTDWDFSRYQANAVVINLGTNDAGHGVTNADFQAAYIALMKGIRAKYPNAAIIALETLRMRYVPETQAAVQALNDAGDHNVYYVSTEGWLIHEVDYTDAGDGHPNDQGHAKMAARLAPIVAPLIGVPTP